LAKAIVREAGLAREPEQETAGNLRRELIESGQGYWQAQVDFFKHMTTVSAATVVGVPAVIKAFVPDPEPALPLYASVGLLLLAALGSIASLLWASDSQAAFAQKLVVRAEEDPFSEYLRDPFRFARLGAYSLYVVGLGIFGFLFAVYVF
jgi:hypothetical protein